MYAFIINDQLNKNDDLSNLALQIFIVPIFHNLPIFFYHPRQIPYKILHGPYIQVDNILMKKTDKTRWLVVQPTFDYFLNE